MKLPINTSIILAKINRLIVTATFLLITVFLTAPAYSQNTVKHDTTISKTDTLVKYLTPMEYAFMMHEQTSWLVKVGIITKSYGKDNFYYAGFEKRIAPAFTLNFSVDYGFYFEDFNMGYQLSLESRWYYRLNKRIKEGQTARNMSDNYVAIGLSNTLLTYEHRNSGNYYSLYAKWGMQRRFLKHGYVDFSIKTGLELPVVDGLSKPFFTFSTNTNLGIAFTKDKNKLQREKLCPVLKCYSSEKYVFKTNLNGLLYLSYANYRKSFSFSPSISFERKIGNSPFSINIGLITFFYYWDDTHYDIKLNNYGAELSLESRWYYNLQHRILNGKTGNGLSASYIAIGGTYRYNHSYVNNVTYSDFAPSVYTITGWQRLYSKHIYTDINIGIGYRFKSQNYNGQVLFPFKLGVGYRF